MGHWLAEVNVTTFAANLAVLIAAIAAAAVGSLTAIKSIKKTFLDIFKDDEVKAKAADVKVASAMIMETTTLLMWSESNRDVVEQLKELRHTMQRLTDKLEDNTRGRA
jgi:hypothetical protein